MPAHRPSTNFILSIATLLVLLLLAAPSAQATKMGKSGGDPMAYPASAIGVVSGTGHGLAIRCSGSVIDTPGPATVVMTAAHCVKPEELPGPVGHLTFTPGYEDGSAPFGIWTVKRYVVDPHWNPANLDLDYSDDVAFLVLADQHGLSLKRLTGSIGVAFDQPHAQHYTEWGYPEGKPYDGESLMHLASGLMGEEEGEEWDLSGPTLGIRSDFTVGSSGGPWTIGPVDHPTAVSMTSYSVIGVHDEMWGPSFGQEAQQLFESVGGEPADAGPRAPHPMRPQVVVHAHKGFGTTIATFGITPEYPLEVDYRCSIGAGPVHACAWPSYIPAGKRLHVEAFIGVPGHRHRLSSTVTVEAIR